ncbi:hypothetical protein ACGFIX_19760 [Nocardia salmonicida]|uniref:hypothetical protein n=1 Tax=Nocardia salmonicida TaxID=53431 RepID=UPI0037218893
MRVVIGDTEIQFVDYPFAGASVYPDGVLAVSEIADADPRAFPPELRTVSGETLFVLASDAPALAEFCRRTEIVVRRRGDIWADLLEPFLDTSFDDEDQRATEARLHRAGIALPEVADIRARVEQAMMSYNFDSMLWEWVHLGLYDLLSAANGVLVRPAARATLGDPAQLYRWAMGIAARTGPDHDARAAGPG